ncbi:hypothetical protein Z945_1429 [Sulfitobacter noctilucae]|nr:hypothetical protein Z945_1429 [Sulfitobacter noctilucae]
MLFGLSDLLIAVAAQENCPLKAISLLCVLKLPRRIAFRTKNYETTK